MKKKCSKCKELKDLSEFNKHKDKKDGYNYNCKLCTNAAGRQHYINNKQRYIDNKNRRGKELREFVSSIKSKSSCIQCGIDHPAVLDFHHRDPSKKDRAICDAKMWGWSEKRIKKEIDKCDVLCSNCHRILHWNENNGSLAQSGRAGGSNPPTAGVQIL